MYKTLENSSRHGTSHEAKFLCIRDKRWLSLIVKIYAAHKILHAFMTYMPLKKHKKSQYHTEYHQKTTYLKNSWTLSKTCCNDENVERGLEMMQRVYELAPRILLYPRREEMGETARVTLPVYLIGSTILHLEVCRAR